MIKWLDDLVTGLFGSSKVEIDNQGNAGQPKKIRPNWWEEIVNPKPQVILADNTQPTSTPQPTATPTPMPTANPQVIGANTQRGTYQPGDPHYMDFSGYNGYSTKSISQPPKNIADMLFQLLPNEATKAATLSFSENVSDPYNINPKPNLNNDGSYDYGFFQSNDRTINELLSKKYGVELRRQGINKPQDVLGNLAKAIAVYKATQQYANDANVYPDSWWYGWQNNGFNPTPKTSLEDKANISGNPYFKLREYMQRTGRI